jgi:hypothetical protein
MTKTRITDYVRPFQDLRHSSINVRSRCRDASRRADGSGRTRHVPRLKPECAYVPHMRGTYRDSERRRGSGVEPAAITRAREIRHGRECAYMRERRGTRSLSSSLGEGAVEVRRRDVAVCELDRGAPTSLAYPSRWKSPTGRCQTDGTRRSWRSRSARSAASRRHARRTGAERWGGPADWGKASSDRTHGSGSP